MTDREYLGTTQVFLVAGKAGVGKTTVSEMIYNFWKEHFNGAVGIMPFAQGVKDISRAMGWDGNKDDKGRVLLQRVGMAGRAYDPNTWVAKTYKTLDSMPESGCIIHDDWRFPNERNYIHFLQERYGLYSIHTIRVEAPTREILAGTPAYNDESEISLPTSSGVDALYYDATIFNEGFGLDWLKDTAERVTKYLLQNERRF